MTVSRISVVVIGGGPAGIAAAIAASSDGASVLLVEREARLGGKLKQSIHDGFGFIRYDEPLTGPEYAFRDISTLEQTNTIVLLQTTVTDIVSLGSTFQLTLSNRHGITIVEATSVVLATGCRERTLVEAGIHGVPTSGVFSAGTVQYYMNVLGQLPVKNPIFLGSNNLVLTTARSLAQIGVRVLGIYEPARAPMGYLQYVSRCLFDYDIPFNREHTITRVFGMERLRGVELARTDSSGSPIRRSENIVGCESFVNSSGFLPHNELASSLSVPLCQRTNGPLCDQNRMTLVEGIFSCGNALHVSDLVDFVTEDGEIAGRSAARYFSRARTLIKVEAGMDFRTVIPQYIDYDILHGETVMFFNPSVERTNASVRVIVDNAEIFSQTYDLLRPSETIRMELSFLEALRPDSKVTIGIT